MADAEFEGRLLRMFDQPPPLDGADAFARRVEARLDRGWGMRQLVIGAAAVVGGVIGAFQMVSSNLAGQMERASAESTALVSDRVETLWRTGLNLSALPLGGEVVWMAAALGVMALAFAVTRAIEEF